jgi:uncharacterized protein YbaP (TraB family)
MKRIAVVTFLLLGGFARAADVAPPVTDWAPNEVVVVSAQASGPALWHLKKGDSEIWILGTIGAMPEKLAWNSGHLADVIDGARVVLTPPTASAGLFETSWFLLTNRGLLSMPDDKKLEDSLPADLRTRFVAARTSLKLDADHFDDDPPVIAALKLETNFDEAKKLNSDEPRETVDKIARQKHVPVKSIAEYGALGLVKELLRLPQETQRVCLEAAVRDVELRSVHAAPAAEAWAAGDVKTVKAHYTPQIFEQCAKATVSFNRLYERSVADYLKAINEALSKPGKAVLLTDIGGLLRNTGVAQQLRSDGVTIEGPAE